MSLFGAGNSESKSSTSSSTSASQTGLQVSDNASALGFGNLSVGGGKKSTTALTINSQTTDFGAIKSALNFADGAFGDATALAGDTLSRGTTANLEFLGQVSKFASLSSQTQLANAKMSESQTAMAIDAVQRAQANALEVTNKLAQDTQTATLKAMDYVFESTKSETGRLAENSLKWIVAAAVVVFVIPLMMKR